MLSPKELRSRRLALGLDSSAMAARARVPESTLIEWEKGDQPIEDPQRLLAILEKMEKSRQSA